MRPLLSIGAQNFRSLRKVDVTLGPLNVLVGPNEAGKSNFLDLIEFLGDSARDDLANALDMRHGYQRVRFRGENAKGAVHVNVKAAVTKHSSENAPDEYELRFWESRARVIRPTRGEESTEQEGRLLRRTEELKFKRTKGRGRRIMVKGDTVTFSADTTDGSDPGGRQEQSLTLRNGSLALSTLQKVLPPDEGGEEIGQIGELFTTFRVFNVDVPLARKPARLAPRPLQPNASNLAWALSALSKDQELWPSFMDDAKAMIPGLEGIELEPVGGGSEAVAVKLRERGLRDATYLDDVSFGTVRVLALLALLHDKKPPKLTCIEEIDHGLHPYLFDRLVERLREASQRTQILLATHSPLLVNRLLPEELIVVERAPDGSTRMPAITAAQVRAKFGAAGGDLALGELWFSGSLGGVPR